jgi:hypothetical protein
VSSVAEIQPDPEHEARQAHLREQARRVELIDKHTAVVAGVTVLLDPATGELTCTVCCNMHDCVHIRRLLEVAEPRQKPRA